MVGCYHPVRYVEMGCYHMCNIFVWFWYQIISAGEIWGGGGQWGVVTIGHICCASSTYQYCTQKGAWVWQIENYRVLNYGHMFLQPLLVDQKMCIYLQLWAKLLDLWIFPIALYSKQAMQYLALWSQNASNCSKYDVVSILTT